MRKKREEEITETQENWKSQISSLFSCGCGFTDLIHIAKLVKLLRYVQFIVCQLDLNKATKKENKTEKDFLGVNNVLTHTFHKLFIKHFY